ncbi:hypothetical protein COW36_16585 [bacterium (Candidatus Blackallbacteria) CG17_big_fil_post_rev_8_21_14_2_50_48_46]|uniref:DUF4194 domain-containing protein n=1 Tax=bacterium (Candidatus Blackallbacteria) CG17_big_fil_post_rev_8_21_14_2_50_48_46 TaxID=2014261 RepID=A0A2M7G1X9_9BACT|nr:MAG: hypothetical protein COW64_08120 [bacterium (Candidatus Blackallbacteria) CG18_big_fil_WC_8_21_14_2_50_49_26]PIW15565.1 MAG: hypothetical protein COW36_16585 [bacterium (Candidatus Blackallbacteria) CG17_big_fil_post_rev_8_21_14_2_50_48_46]PIW49356.1 MAG: hypothetical protein COW20_06015 [bacterium (Candidatus Blackallbacteria) CG13_big_fil_rev_8_21_14_2_50_49_14]
MSTPEKVEPYAPVIVKLLGGELTEDDRLWNDLLHFRAPVSEYLARIGLEVVIDPKEGFAFLRQVELDEEGRTIGLIKRNPLSYEVTLICVVLREMLEDFDMNPSSSPYCHITHKQIREQIELFFKEKSNQVKLLRQLDRYIKQIVELGFLRVIQEGELLDERIYEIRRIIKAKITNDVLEDIRYAMEQDASIV